MNKTSAFTTTSCCGWRHPLVALALVALIVSGCSSRDEVSKTPGRAFRTSLRQLPPQPVYSRVTFVPLPEMLPSRELPASAAGLMSPPVHINIKNVSLEEASAVLAAVSRYSSYTASSIAKQRISLNMLGTLEEVAQRIASEASIKVVIDHETRQVRFLTGKVLDESSDLTEERAPEEPRFLSE